MEHSLLLPLCPVVLTGWWEVVPHKTREAQPAPAPTTTAIRSSLPAAVCQVCPAPRDQAADPGR